MTRRHDNPARFLIVVLALIAGSSVAATLRPAGNSVAGEVLVKIQPGASHEELASLEHGADVDHDERISSLKSGTIWRLHSRSLNVDALTNALQRNPKVIYVEPNYVVRLISTPNDALYAQMWALKNTGQTINGSPGT